MTERMLIAYDGSTAAKVVVATAARLEFIHEDADLCEVADT